MSSTNRGYDRHVADYYVTPKWAIKDFINEWFCDLQEEEEYNVVPARPDKLLWFDPCAGGSDTEGMSYPEVLEELFGVQINTNDIREDSKAEKHEDYLEMTISGDKPNIIITNPPFYLAKEIIQKSLEDVDDGGYVVMLLRLNFFGSKERKQFLQDNMPERCYVHSKRMSFTKEGKTDSIEYMHAVWKKGENVEFTKLKII